MEYAAIVISNTIKVHMGNEYHPISIEPVNEKFIKRFNLDELRANDGTVIHEFELIDDDVVDMK